MASPCFQRPAVASYPDGSPLLLSAASHAAWSELVHRSRQMIHRALEQPVVLYSESDFHGDGSD